MAKNNYVRTQRGIILSFNTRTMLANAVDAYMSEQAEINKPNVGKHTVWSYVIKIPTMEGRNVVGVINANRYKGRTYNGYLHLRYEDGSRLYKNGLNRKQFMALYERAKAQERHIPLSRIIKYIIDRYNKPYGLHYDCVEFVKLFGIKYPNPDMIRFQNKKIRAEFKRLLDNGVVLIYNGSTVTNAVLNDNSMKITYSLGVVTTTTLGYVEAMKKLEAVVNVTTLMSH